MKNPYTNMKNSYTNMTYEDLLIIVNMAIEVDKKDLAIELLKDALKQAVEHVDSLENKGD